MPCFLGLSFVFSLLMPNSLIRTSDKNCFFQIITLLIDCICLMKYRDEMRAVFSFSGRWIVGGQGTPSSFIYDSGITKLQANSFSSRDGKRVSTGWCLQYITLMNHHIWTTILSRSGWQINFYFKTLNPLSIWKHKITLMVSSSSGWNYLDSFKVKLGSHGHISTTYFFWTFSFLSIAKSVLCIHITSE